MKNLLLLQFRKNALTFGVLLAALLLSPPLAMLFKPAGAKGAEAISLAMLFWLLAGIPFSALLLAGIAGSEAAREPAALTEQPLPVSQYKVLLSGLLTAALGTAALALAAWAVSGFNVPLAKLTEVQRSFFDSYAFVLAALSLYAFTLSFVFANGIAGGVLAAALVAAGVIPAIAIMVFQIFYFDLVPLYAIKPLLVLLAAAGALLALKLFSGAAGRKAAGPARAYALGAALLAAPVLLSWGALLLMNTRARLVTLPADNGLYFSELLPYQRLSFDNGLILLQKPFNGELFFVDDNGGRTLIKGGLESRAKDFAYLFPDNTFASSTAVRGKDGKIWVLRRESYHKARLFSGGTGGFTEHLALDGRTDLTGGKEPGITSRKAGGIFFAPLPYAGTPEWKKIGTKEREATAFLLKKYTAEGLAAEAAGDRRTISAGRNRWRIPGKALSSVIPGLPTPDGAAFFVPVGSGDSYVTYPHLPGGRDSAPWPGYFHPGHNLFVTPDGTIWGRTESRNNVFTRKFGFLKSRKDLISPVFRLITRDGSVLPPLRADSILKKTGVYDGRLYLLRAKGGSLWFNAGDKYLVKADAANMDSFELWKMPAPIKGLRYYFREGTVVPVPDGVIIAAAGGAYFMNWDGETRKI